MNLAVQIIEKDGQPEWAVIPYTEFQRLRELAEDAEDIRAINEALADDGETVPHEVMSRLVDGESPLRVWREHRGLTQEALAERANIGKSYISQLEAGKKTGSAKVLKTLARILVIDVDDLIATN